MNDTVRMAVTVDVEYDVPKVWAGVLLEYVHGSGGTSVAPVTL
ncbi:MAG: hypothetical protein ACR2O6_10770 [Ilumatobacteraceae bacterium]